MQTLPDIIFKFALNATLDTLPHRKNLYKWKKSDSDKCPLCGNIQSLLHVLNHCSFALEQRRYDQRHDTILARLFDLMTNSSNGYKVIVDLPNHSYERPPFLVSNLRPDLVMWSDRDKTCYLIELTICFDTNPKGAEGRKSRRYVDLAEYITSLGFSCHVIPLQVGSWGFIDLDSFAPLKDLLSITAKDFHSCLIQLAADAIIGSFHIWSRRNCSSWSRGYVEHMTFLGLLIIGSMFSAL
jgi:hypothetical protein